MCFGGGVFLATYMLHMGPDVRTIMNDALLEPHGITYPITDLIVASGFFLVLIVETSALRANRHHEKKQTKHQDAVPPESSPSEATHALRSLDNGDAGVEYAQHGHSHGVSYEANTRSLVLALALSLHRIFEGMSIGLKHTVRGVVNLLIAVMCHETVIGFSLGLEFVHSGFSKKRTLVFAALCSVIMPIGVAIGTIVMEMGSESPYIDMVNGILQAISTGTFLYVTFFEILQDEFGHNKANFGKVSAWSRHEREPLFALLVLCTGNPPVIGGFPSQRASNAGFNVLFDVSINKRLL